MGLDLLNILMRENFQFPKKIILQIVYLKVGIYTLNEQTHHLIKRKEARLLLLSLDSLLHFFEPKSATAPRFIQDSDH